MGRFVLTNASITVGGTDLSNKCASVTVNLSQPEEEVTAMGDGGHVTLLGLPDCSFEVTWRQDYTAAKVDATNWTLFTGGPLAVVVKADSAAVGPTNPSWTGTCVLTDYKPISGSIGDAAEATTTYVATGTIVRAIA